MLSKIKKFFKSKLFIDTLTHMLDLIFMFGLVVVIYCLLINAIYYAINLVNFVPCDLDILNTLKGVIYTG